MVACVSAEARDQKETLSTLHYASVARQVVNTVALAQDPQQAKVAQLEAEIARLRAGAVESAELSAVVERCERLEGEKQALERRLGTWQRETQAEKEAALRAAREQAARAVERQAAERAAAAAQVAP